MDTLKVSQAILKNALANVGKATPGKTTLPVLDCILFHKEDNETLRLSATNLEVGVSAKVLASFDGGFQDICLPAKTVNELIGTFPNDSVAISVDSRTMTAKIVSGNSKSSVKGIDGLEFPPIQSQLEGGIALPDDFSDAVSRVSIACSSDEARPVLAGVYIELKNGKISLYAADGFRLATMPLDIEYSGEDVGVIVPAFAMKEFARMSKNLHSWVSFEKGKIVFKIGDTILVSQLIDGKYPELSQIIPTTFETTARVSSAMLKNATKQARIFSREGNSSTTLRISQEGITVEGKSDETGQTSTLVTASVEGKDLSVAFNAAFLAEGLDAIKSPETTIKLSASTSPGFFSGDDKYIYVIMPMMLD